MSECLFCQFVSGHLPCHKVWEDAKHIAFLTIFPNTEGATVVIPKKHFESYAFDLDDNILSDLVKAAKEVGKILDRAFEDVGRTAMVFEGFGINHVHAKLYPLHGTKLKSWKPIVSNQDKTFSHYEGFISSHDGPQADNSLLLKIVEKIKASNNI